MINIQLIQVEKIHNLRNKILRPGLPIETVFYDCDKDITCFHVAAIELDKVIGTATFYKISHISCKGENVYRLRGMAVENNCQGQGVGKKILDFAFLELKKRKIDFLWCNARLIALDFYKKLNFKIYGEIFNIKDIGPHYVMYIKI